MDANNVSKGRRSFSWISSSQSYRRLFNRNRVGHFDVGEKTMVSTRFGLKRCEAVWNIHSAAMDYSYKGSVDLSPIQDLPSLSSVPSTSSFLPDDDNSAAAVPRSSNTSDLSMPLTPATPDQCDLEMGAPYGQQKEHQARFGLDYFEGTHAATTDEHQQPPLPVRSATMPLCKITKDSEENLADTSADVTESKSNNRLHRVATWLGQPFNKLIHQAAKIRPLTQREASPDEDSEKETVDTHSESDTTSFFGCTPSNLNMHNSQYSTNNHLVYQQETSVVKSNPFQRTRTLHCKVPLIINQGSCRPFEYELHLQKNGVTVQTFNGKLDKLGKIASVDHTSNIEFTVDMQEDHIDLAFVLTGRVMRTSSIEKGLAWIQNACISDKVAPQPFRFPVIGYLQLTSDESLESFVAQASKLYTLTQPLCNRPPNSQLKMQLYFEVEDTGPKYEFMPSLSECDEDFAMRHCQIGDYITLHVRGKPGAPAKWVRYWAAVRNRRLWLHDFDHTNKKLIASIPLQPLVAASKPSDEDLEKICLCRRTGVVLRFNRDYAKIQEPTILDENESFEAKLFMFADNVDSCRCWLKAMQTLAAEPQSPACDRSSPSKYSQDGVNLRYLW